MIEMAKKEKISEKNIAAEYGLLQATHAFLTRLQKTKQSELEFCLKQLETNFSDEMEARCHRVHAEIKGIINKINWEIKRISEFDKKVAIWKKQQQMSFISELSKKILDRNK